MYDDLLVEFSEVFLADADEVDELLLDRYCLGDLEAAEVLGAAIDGHTVGDLIPDWQTVLETLLEDRGFEEVN